MTSRDERLDVISSETGPGLFFNYFEQLLERYLVNKLTFMRSLVGLGEFLFEFYSYVLMFLPFVFL